MSDKFTKAFPVEGMEVGSEGMNLRDYFAAKAMQGIVASMISDSEYMRLKDVANANKMSVSKWIARDAYKQADAMMEARKV